MSDSSFNSSLSFSDYFSLRVSEAEIADHFGYKFSREYLDLPTPESVATERSVTAEEITAKAIATKEAIAQILPYVSLDSEIARREILISPFMYAAIALAKPQLNIEYYLNVESQLKGTVDYYLHSQDNQILIVEAKLADIDRGFKQLIPELIAFEKKTETTSYIFGAVTTGSVWCFARLCPINQEFKRDLNLYLLPNNTDELLRIFLGILL